MAAGNEHSADEKRKKNIVQKRKIINQWLQNTSRSICCYIFLIFDN